MTEPDELQQFVYSLSHDMSAPIRAMVQFSQLINQRCADKLEDREKYWLDLMVQNGQHAQKMLDSLLIYSRLKSQEPDYVSFSLLSLAEEVSDRLQRRHGSAQITVKGEDRVIRGPKEHWEIYLQAVLSNALLFQPADNDHVARINVDIAITDDKTRCAIADNGIGVREEKRDDMVLPFKRFHAESDYPGIGMGLTFCDRIIRMQRGVLTFSESALGGLCVTASV